MDERVARLKTVVDCERFAINAAERDRDDLAQEARQRLVEIKTEEYDAKSDAERAVIEAVYAHEEALTKKNGKRTRASRIWPMIRKYGIIPAIDRVVSRADETTEYALLLEMGLQDYAFEAAVLNYPELFSSDATSRSQARVDAWQAG